MKTLALGLVAVLLLAAALLGGLRSPAADAQDTSEDRLAALETAVAGHDREIEDLRDRIATLEAGAQTDAPGEDGTPGETADQATEAATDDAPRASADQGTRDNPVPMETAADVGDWTVTVVDAVPDATDLILRENQFNDPPLAGSQFYLITLRATYTGTEPATFFWSLTWSAVGEAAVSYSEGEHRCGSLPNDVADVPEVFEGGEIEGNICFAVRAEDVDSLVLYLSPLGAGDNVFFALRRAAGDRHSRPHQD